MEGLMQESNKHFRIGKSKEKISRMIFASRSTIVIYKLLLHNAADFEMKTIRKKELGEDELMDEREIKEKMVVN